MRKRLTITLDRQYSPWPSSVSIDDIRVRPASVHVILPRHVFAQHHGYYFSFQFDSFSQLMKPVDMHTALCGPFVSRERERRKIILVEH